jgi:hypothetical protein
MDRRASVINGQHILLAGACTYRCRFGLGGRPRNAHHGPASPTLSSIGLAPNQCRAGRVLMPAFLAILQPRDVADLPTV